MRTRRQYAALPRKSWSKTIMRPASRASSSSEKIVDGRRAVGHAGGDAIDGDARDDVGAVPHDHVECHEAEARVPREARVVEMQQMVDILRLCAWKCRISAAGVDARLRARDVCVVLFGRVLIVGRRQTDVPSQTATVNHDVRVTEPGWRQNLTGGQARRSALSAVVAHRASAAILSMSDAGRSPYIHHKGVPAVLRRLRLVATPGQAARVCAVQVGTSQKWMGTRGQSKPWQSHALNPPQIQIGGLLKCPPGDSSR